MKIEDLDNFNKIVNLKLKKIEELKKVVFMLDSENSLAYHDITILDLKNKIKYIEKKIDRLYDAKEKKESIDVIRKIAYKEENSPYITQKAPELMYDNYMQLLASCERITLDFIEYRKRFSNTD